MATFTKKMSGDDRYSITLTVTESSYSIANNSSTVSYSLTATKSSGTGYYTSNTNNPYKVSINNGVVKNDSKAYDFRNATPKTITLASGTTTVPHDDDGKKTIAVSGYFKDANNSLGSATASGSFKLTDIPRASAITAPNYVDLDTATTITLTRYSNDYINDLYYSFGTHTDVQFATGVTDSATLTLPKTLANDIPNDYLGTLEIKCMTYNQNDSSYIGTSKVTTNARVPYWQLEFKPSVVISSPAINNTSDYPTSWGVFIKGKCKADYTITAQGKYGASITNYASILGGYTYITASVTTNVLMAAGNYSLSGEVVDSRGAYKTISAANYITVLDYNNPTLGTMEIQRCDVNGSIDRNGNYVLVNFSGSITSCNNKNTPHAVYKIGYKVHGTDTYTYIPCGTNADTYSQSGMLYTDGIYPANRGSGTKQQLPSTNTYDIQFFVGDYFTSTTSEQQLDTGFDLMNFNASGKSMAIGKVSEASANEEKLEIALATTFSEPVTAGTVNFTASSYHDSTKQDTLVSGTNIKSINNTTLLGSGDISVQPTLSVTTGTLNITKTSGNSSCTGTYALYGKVLHFDFAFALNGVTNSGNEIFVGTCSTFTPKIAINASGFVGGRAIICAWGTDNKVTCRNSSSTNINNTTSTVHVRGTCIIN